MPPTTTAYRNIAVPIILPPSLKHDRAIRRLLTAWLHAHARYRVCTKRVNWQNTASIRIEKARRKEKWICVAKIFDIEHTLLRWLATGTHHPDLWVKPSSDALSRRNALRREYYRTRAREHRCTGNDRATAKIARARIVTAIRALDRTWMLALLSAVDPTAHVPDPLPLHPRELLPRKIVRAAKHLLADLLHAAA